MIKGINSKNDNAPIELSQDVNVYVSELDKGITIGYELQENRQAYLVCAEGKLSVNAGEFVLDTREAARLYGEIGLSFTAMGDDADCDEYTKEPMPSAHIMLIEMKKDNNWDDAKEPNKFSEEMSSKIVYNTVYHIYYT